MCLNHRWSRAAGDSGMCLVCAAVCDEKAAATSALGVYAEETQAAFGPFLEQSLKCLLGMCIYFHETVRAQAFEALPRVLAATLVAFPPPAEGAHAAVHPPASLSPQNAAFMTS